MLVALGGCGGQRAPASAEVTLPTVKMRTLEERAAYAGSEACAKCHSEIAATHRESHHAHTLSLVTPETHGDRFERPSKVRDPRRDLDYEMGVKQGRCTLTVRRGKETDEVAATLGVGSGKNATTYLGEFRSQLLELRLSYYSGARRWDFSPGQQVDKVSGGVLYPVGLVKLRDTVDGCFACHATAAVRSGLTLDVDASLMGVGCEACHGPGKRHIEAAERRESDLKMASLKTIKPRISRELCGQCHRSPSSEDLNDPFNKSQLPRLQGLALSQSLCFTNSQGKLSCLSCHPAHGNTTSTRPQYNAVCASCHSGAAPDQRQCMIGPKGDCVSCHMPAQPVGMPTGLRYRTHWIRVWDNPDIPIPSLHR